MDCEEGLGFITEPRRSLADLLESLTATEGKASRPGNGGSETLSPDEDPAPSRLRTVSSHTRSAATSPVGPASCGGRVASARAAWVLGLLLGVPSWRSRACSCSTRPVRSRPTRRTESPNVGWNRT